MEVMDVEEGTGPATTGTKRNEILIWCVTKKHGLKRSKIPVRDFSTLQLESLKAEVLQELNSWEWVDENDKPKDIDILHRSRVLKTDEDVKRIGPLSVVTVVKKASNSDQEDHRSEKFIAEYAAQHKVNDRLRSCSIALRTAFLNPKFATMIEGLRDIEKLESIFAIVPELRNDPVAIGIIQDHTLLFHMSDPEALKKLTTTKPWLIQAFEFIAASIHQERDLTPQGIPPHLFNPNVFDGEGDDESMEDDDDEGGAAGPSRNPVITREQLAAALSGLGGGGVAGASANPFGNLFGAPQSSAPAQQPQSQQPTPNPVAQAGANIQNLMNTLAGAGGGVPGQPLNSDVVARAVTDALRRLTPEQRMDQMLAIRNFASQLNQQAPNNSSAPANPSAPVSTAPPPVQATPPAQPNPSPASSLSQQYQAQLRQMREMGITDERLSILALRVSEGDVNTAVELIFSGWQGEGSDPTD